MKTLEKGKKVSVRGVCSYTVEQAKNGSSFVKGEISDKGDIFPFKIWDATSLEVDLEQVVEIEGIVKEYDGFCYIEGTKAVNVLDDIVNYVASSVVDGAYMRSAIGEMVSTCCVEWEQVLTTALDRESLLVASLPNSAHTERGGFISHLYEALYLAFAECDRLLRLGVQTNRSIIVAGLLLSKLYYLDNYEFNPVTGEVVSEDKVRRALLGRATSVIGAAMDARRLLDDSYLPIMNVVAAVNGVAEPVTPEAIIVCDAFRAELRAFESAKVYASLEDGAYVKTGNLTVVRM